MNPKHQYAECQTYGRRTEASDQVDDGAYTLSLNGPPGPALSCSHVTRFHVINLETSIEWQVRAKYIIIIIQRLKIPHSDSRCRALTIRSHNQRARSFSTLVKESSHLSSLQNRRH